MLGNWKPNFEFLGLKYQASILSATILLIGIVSIIVKGGLTLGIDFKGGTNVRLLFDKPVKVNDIRGILSAKLSKSVIIQRLGDEANNEIMIVFSEEEQFGDKQSLTDFLKAELLTKYPNTEIRNIAAISSKVGDEMITKALNAVLAALILILAYISFRFHPKFGAAAIITLVHDVMFIVGYFSIFNIEFTLSVVAALLTVVGYSLNDTIVVFDRIRENMGRFRAKPMESIINLSINETLSRTIITSLTTLGVVSALLILGGQIIHDFALALFIGIIVGTYSSIYVSSSLIVTFSNFTQKEKVEDKI